MDAFSNPLARLGAGTPDATQYTQYVKQNFTAQYNTLTALYRENWVVKRLIDVVPEDMTKNWYRINSQLAPDSKQQIARLERKTRVLSKVLDGLKWGRLYGGAVAVIIIDGHDDILDQPLHLDTIMPGSFKGLIVVDRWSGVSPSLEIVDNIDDSEFGLPKYYTIYNNAFGLGVRVHHSRILRFIGRPLPYIEELSESYWGTSELEHVYSEIVKYDNTSFNIAALVFSANLKVYKMEGFEQLATAPSSVQRDLYNTLTMMNYMMNSQGMQIMGQQDSFETQQYSFAGLSDIYEMFMLDVSGASEIPVTKLFGRSPAGMNATGESDMANYFDGIEEKQEAYLRPIIDRLLPILCMSEFSSVPDDLDFEFEPIRRPSEDEKKTISTQITTAVTSVFNAGIISQQIALKELRESARATGMWNNITDEDIANADSEFGIGGEPPDVMGAIGATPQAEEAIQTSPTPPQPSTIGDSVKKKGITSRLTSTTDDDEVWITTKNGSHVLLGEGGEVKAGMGGKFNGEKISAVSPKSYSEAATGTTVTYHAHSKTKGDYDLKYTKQPDGTWKSLQKGSTWTNEELEKHLSNAKFEDLDLEQPQAPQQATPTSTSTMTKSESPFSISAMQSAEAGTSIAYSPAKGKQITYTKGEDGKWVNEANGASYSQKALEKVMSGTNPDNLKIVTSAPEPIHAPTAEHYATATAGTTVEYKPTKGPAKGKTITYTKGEDGKWTSSTAKTVITQKYFENLMSNTNPDTLTMMPPGASASLAPSSSAAIPTAPQPVTANTVGSQHSASNSGSAVAGGAVGSNPFAPDSYSQERKDNAVWAKTKEASYKEFANDTSATWSTMTQVEKKAAYDYTDGSGKFNRPLRGYEDFWDWQDFKGVGNVSLNQEGAEKQINALTKAIEKSVSTKDAWLQRGVNNNGAYIFATGDVKAGAQAGAKEVKEAFEKAMNSGEVLIDHGFNSNGSSKGTGFSGDVVINTYAPKGTRMIYAEPFSHFGKVNQGGAKWDGIVKSGSVKPGHENETIIQRGTGYRVTKVEQSGGKLYVDVEVVSQRPVGKK
ncbi:hypothetical protein FACS1894187_07020 [Synergistales bacterium]|nr:hypothetical protein FACS1894187_07020 [Synergistales bacterium]